MAGDPVPIDVFVQQVFQMHSIIGIFSSWRIEPSRLQDYITAQFKEMGVYFVTYSQKQLTIDTITFILKNSRELKRMVRRAEESEIDRRRSRHAG